jgi:hypothetical protein
MSSAITGKFSVPKSEVVSRPDSEAITSYGETNPLMQFFLRIEY